MADVSCITCAHIGRKPAPPAMAKAGFSVCPFDRDPGTYVSVLFPRKCDRHVPAADDLVRRRREWLGAQR